VTNNLLKGKTALITGAAKGIGRAILLKLADEGCNIILHYYKSSIETKSIIKNLRLKKIKTFLYSADLKDEKQVSGMFQKIKRHAKKLDILVNNVGNYLIKDLNTLKTKEWHEIINSNLNSTYYCTHYALPLIRKSNLGRIINIGYASSGQILAKPRILPYQIAKTGVLLMTKSYALDEAKNKILVNMISPGVMENSIPHPKKEIPLGKVGSLKGFADLVLYVIKSDYITGAHIEYAGGFNV